VLGNVMPEPKQVVDRRGLDALIENLQEDILRYVFG
jgi:hypothetical protein